MSKKYNLENALDEFESLSEIEAMENVNGGSSDYSKLTKSPLGGNKFVLCYGVFPTVDLGNIGNVVQEQLEKKKN